jgi:hypothetical protein
MKKRTTGVDAPEESVKQSKPSTQNEPTIVKQTDDVFYCVLESADGARILTAIAAKEYVKDNGMATGQYTIHFAGDHDNATSLQMMIESKMQSETKLPATTTGE